jgi:hypothetical protein
MLPPVRIVFLLSISVLCCAQTPAAANPISSEHADKNEVDTVLPVITFTLDFPASQPEHYSIRIPSDGPAHYQSTGRISRDSEDTDSFDFDFALSAELRGRAFRLAAGAGHFKRDIDSHQKNLAFMGNKTLSYKDAHETGEASFNYSANPEARELAELFQNLSATLEFGHRLDYDRRYQKLALDDELKRMQQMEQDKELIEVAAIQTILEQIIADHSVINVARARAQQLLKPPASVREK